MSLDLLKRDQLEKWKLRTSVYSPRMDVFRTDSLQGNLQPDRIPSNRAVKELSCSSRRFRFTRPSSCNFCMLEDKDNTLFSTKLSRSIRVLVLKGFCWLISPACFRSCLNSICCCCPGGTSCTSSGVASSSGMRTWSLQLPSPSQPPSDDGGGTATRDPRHAGSPSLGLHSGASGFRLPESCRTIKMTTRKKDLLKGKKSFILPHCCI